MSNDPIKIYFKLIDFKSQSDASEMKHIEIWNLQHTDQTHMRDTVMVELLWG